MPDRWGLGPVFACEALLGARRWQVYAARSLFVLMLLTAMTGIWMAHARGPDAGVVPAPRFEANVTPSPRLAATVGACWH
jgi:hypothetical protein